MKKISHPTQYIETARVSFQEMQHGIRQRLQSSTLVERGKVDFGGKQINPTGDPVRLQPLGLNGPAHYISSSLVQVPTGFFHWLL